MTQCPLGLFTNPGSRLVSNWALRRLISLLTSRHSNVTINGWMLDKNRLIKVAREIKIVINHFRVALLWKNNRRSGGNRNSTDRSWLKWTCTGQALAPRYQAGLTSRQCFYRDAEPIEWTVDTGGGCGDTTLLSELTTEFSTQLWPARKPYKKQLHTLWPGRQLYSTRAKGHISARPSGT